MVQVFMGSMSGGDRVVIISYAQLMAWKYANLARTYRNVVYCIRPMSIDKISLGRKIAIYRQLQPGIEHSFWSVLAMLISSMFT